MYSNVTVQKIDGNIDSKILKWNAEAKDFFYQWQRENCERVNEYENNIKGEIISKFDSHFIRLSLLLQLMEDPQSNEIQIRAVNGAKTLCNYYMNSSFKVLAILQNPVEYLKTLPDNKRNFHNMISAEFTTGNAIEIGKKFDIQERRVKDFLKDTILFKNIKHGFYEKMIKNKQE